MSLYVMLWRRTECGLENRTCTEFTCKKLFPYLMTVPETESQCPLRLHNGDQQSYRLLQTGTDYNLEREQQRGACNHLLYEAALLTSVPIIAC